MLYAGMPDCVSAARRGAPKHVTVPEDCLFYQAIELPGIGLVKGSWDHRDTVDEYLAHFDFRGRRALDVGPANGFFSFEMERRGASVTALDLGPEGTWDAVPHPYVDPLRLASNLRDNIRRVENAFRFARERLGSSVELLHGAVYDAPSIVPSVDVALMGNILQHLRDPFRAIQQVAAVVTDTIIITESIWDDDAAFAAQGDMRLMPRAETPYCNHSWWQVSPELVVQILRLLGFLDLSTAYHHQRFVTSSTDQDSRLVKHFTVAGHRHGAPSRRDGPLVPVAHDSSSWHGQEADSVHTWRWSSSRTATVQMLGPSAESTVPVDIAFGLGSAQHDRVEITLNGKRVWKGDVIGYPIPLLVTGALRPGTNVLEFVAEKEPLSVATDPRALGVLLYDLLVWPTRSR